MTVRKRHTDTAPWPEVEPLLAQARQALNVTSNKEVLNYIGYASSNVAGWQQKGVVALRLKYALLGLLADLNHAPRRNQARGHRQHSPAAARRTGAALSCHGDRGMTDFTLTIVRETLYVLPNTEAARRDIEPFHAIGGRYPFSLQFSGWLCQDWRAKGLTYSYEGSAT